MNLDKRSQVKFSIISRNNTPRHIAKLEDKQTLTQLGQIKSSLFCVSAQTRVQVDDISVLASLGI